MEWRTANKVGSQTVLGGVQSGPRRDYLMQLASGQWSGKPPAWLCPQHPLSLSRITRRLPAAARLHMSLPRQAWIGLSPPPTPAKGSRSYSSSTLLETWPWSHLYDFICSGSQQKEWLSPFRPSEINHSDYVFLEKGLTLILMGSSGWLVLKKKESTA